MGRHRRIDNGNRPITDFIAEYQHPVIPDNPQCCTAEELESKIRFIDSAYGDNVCTISLSWEQSSADRRFAYGLTN